MAIEDEVEVKLGIEERLEKIGRLLDVCLAAPAAVLAKLIRELDDHALPLQSLHRSSSSAGSSSCAGSSGSSCSLVCASSRMSCRCSFSHASAFSRRSGRMYTYSSFGCNS